MQIRREEITKQLGAQVKLGRHILGVASGAGISARYAVKGGADLILALNAGRFRQMGRGSLASMMPYGNANELVMGFGTREILPVVGGRAPVIFGLCATDPTIRLETYLPRIGREGFSGVNNYPSIGLVDGQIREALEEEGIGYGQEVEAIRLAGELGLFTIAFVFTPRHAEQMLEAGADVICAHMGLTRGGVMGAKKFLSLEAAAGSAREIFAVCDRLRPGVIRLIYGGPIQTALDMQYLYNNSSAMGYIGGSAFDRIPYETALQSTTSEFRLAGAQDEWLSKMLDGIEKHYDYVSFVREYVAANYMNDISFGDLAMVAHVSRTHLSALFRREVGSTFPQYLNRYRINKAIEIMKRQAASLTETATLVGYNDYAHFSKMFKQVTGLSPRDYAARTQREEF